MSKNTSDSVILAFVRVGQGIGETHKNILQNHLWVVRYGTKYDSVLGYSRSTCTSPVKGGAQPAKTFSIAPPLSLQKAEKEELGIKSI
mmetsp:Transcript_50122/g.129008  ORF Transcript_50122/g.129008 Transcript_50122/m.129008 type:complete len:88 (+) Transcript_50122:584-847(+)